MNTTLDVSRITISKESRITGEFEVGHMVPHLTIKDDEREIHLIVERELLERIVKLAQHLLAVPETGDPTRPQLVYESTCDDGVHERTRLALVHPSPLARGPVEPHPDGTAITTGNGPTFGTARRARRGQRPGGTGPWASHTTPLPASPPTPIHLRNRATTTRLGRTTMTKPDRNNGLLKLLTPWIHGATLAAGVGAFPPAADVPRTLLAERCPRENCTALILGTTDAQLDQHVADHLNRHA
jgi:hypothetical protein